MSEQEIKQTLESMLNQFEDCLEDFDFDCSKSQADAIEAKISRIENTFFSFLSLKS